MRKYGKDCSFPQYPAFIQWKSCDFSTNVTKQNLSVSVLTHIKLKKKKYPPTQRLSSQRFLQLSSKIEEELIKKELFLKQLFLHGVLEIRKLRGTRIHSITAYECPACMRAAVRCGCTLFPYYDIFMALVFHYILSGGKQSLPKGQAGHGTGDISGGNSLSLP